MHKENTRPPGEERHVREGVATSPGRPRAESMLYGRADVRPQGRDQEALGRAPNPVAVLIRLHCNDQLRSL
jgi:hypothetical protein